MNDNPYAAPKSESQAELATEITGARPLATRWQRFAGNLIDTIVLVIGVLVIVVVFYALVDFVYPDYFEMAETPLAWLIESIVAVVSMSVVFLVANGYLLAKNGQTLGKLAVGTQIVSDNNELVPLSKIFLARYLFLWIVSMLPAIGSFVSLADALMIVRDNKKCLHDDLAGTKVVMLKTPAHYRQLPEDIEIPGAF